MMNAHGTLFLGKTAPLATRAADGAYALTLLAFDRIGPHRVEPWRITWTGPDAEAFYTAQGSLLKAGQPVVARLERMRTFTNGKFGASEIHAVVLDLELAPHSHQTGL